MKKLNLLFALLGLLILTSCKNDPEITFDNNFSIELNDSIISLATGGQQKLVFSTTPTNAKYLSSDTTIAKVNNLGIITGVSVGNATITVTGTNNFSGKCKVKVTDTSVSELSMPDVNYPINNSSTFIIMGIGFKEGDKIWLRKQVTNSSTISKVKGASNENNATQGSDYLATIREIAANYIALSANVPDGWYQVILENNKKAYNLGNLQFNTIVLPEYPYDKTKIFWDDTHLRWMQLRGAVKEMKASQIDYWGTPSDPMTVHYLFRLNIKGFLTSSLSSWGDSVSMGYDNSNRITTMIDYPGTNSISGIVTGSVGEKYTHRYTFSYGNHTKYYRIGFNYAGYTPFLCYMTDVNFGMGDNFYEGFWVKGLTGITSKDATFNISIFNDSIVSTESHGTTYTYNSTAYYKGAFPYQEIRILNEPNSSSNGNIIKTFFDFSGNGQIKDYKSDRYYTWSDTYYKNYDSIEYKVNAPFQQYTIKHEGSAVGGVRKFKYDSNYNVIEDEWALGSSNTVITTYFNYVSYDEKGNWTECIVIENDNRWPDNDKVWKLTREFKYW
jgi:hypothetical protein